MTVGESPLLPDERRSIEPGLPAGIVGVETLRNKRPHVLTARVHTADGASSIAKVWRHGIARGLALRAARTGNCEREWRALSRLAQRGCAVPEPILRAHAGPLGSTDVVLVADLGECTRLSDHAKQMALSGRTERTEEVQDAIVRTTAQMVAAGVFDADHTMTNFVVAPGGRIVRLDLELAVIRSRLLRRLREYGQMLGAIVGTYVFAVQPDMELARRLALSLAAELSPPAEVLRRAAAEVDLRLEAQRRTGGPDVSLRLEW